MLKLKQPIHRHRDNRLRCGLAVIAFATISLVTGTFANTLAKHQGPGLDLRGPRAMPFETLTAKPNQSAAHPVNVANVEELYATVNDTANAGAVIVLAPGVYILSANGADGSPRANGGRLELQRDMSLTGTSGDRSAVVIDTSMLPLSSLSVALGRTGPIRMGRGSNSIEWLTILGNPLAMSGIETDLNGTPPTEIRVTHVVSGDSSRSYHTRGVDVRNVGAAMAGRKIAAEIEDSEFFGGVEGIRFVNLNGANGGQIDATMTGNRFHNNKTGCVVSNLRSNSGLVEVRSNGDRFEDNGLGCVIAGGIVPIAAVTANSNSTTFEAYTSKFINNTGPIDVSGGGIAARGGETLSAGMANSASNNSAVLRLWGCAISGNQNMDFEALGAHSTSVPAGIAGTNNQVTIELHGISRFVNVVATDSLPSDPAGTNTVTVTMPAGDNPVDDTQFFVGQHYLDFLNRAADASGLAFWSNQITSCGSDSACIEMKRENVSAAFFLSIEFQETDYLVYRMYKAAYSNLPDSPVPVKFSELLPDAQEISHRLIVGQSGWETVLENNKQAFANQFVQRSRFTSAYPQTKSAAEFVDQLNANAGNPLSQTERDHLVSDLATGAKTRAQVLRAVAENQNLSNAEFNRAFVLMQYFGYLRRDPNSGPDTNFDGYNFWLNKLNAFNGDYANAEMVKAFITSSEYRNRFGS